MLYMSVKGFGITPKYPTQYTPYTFMVRIRVRIRGRIRIRVRVWVRVRIRVRD